MKLIDITGKAISGEWGNDCEDGNGIPVLRTTNFTDTGVINFANVVLRDIPTKDLSKKFLRPGDIIIEKSGGSDTKPVGRVVYFDSEENKYLINNFTGLLRVVDQTKWYPRYVFYALFANYSFGGTRQYENKTTGLHNLKLDQYLNSFDIPDVDFQLQHHIADTLDKVSEGIEVCRKMLGELDLMVKAKFVEMFENENYPHTELINLIKDGMGLSYGIVQPGDDGTGEMGVLRPVDMVGGKISMTSIKYIDRSIGDGFRKTELTGDELLITVRGTTGVTALTDARFTGMNVTRGIAVIRYDREKINPVYLNAYLNTDESQRYIQEHTRGATLQQINLSDLRIQDIVVPPINLQNRFAAFIAEVDKSKLTVQRIRDKMEMEKLALMQKYFA